MKADVSVSADVRRMVAEVENQLGSVDILINNAGIAHPRKLEDISEADWDEILTVNLKSVFLVTQAVVGGMRQRKWGRIINLSSVAAQTGGAVGAHYAASKAGMIGLTHSCAAAFVKEGITVNAIAPALIETEMVTNNLNATHESDSDGAFRFSGRCLLRCRHACDERLHDRADYFGERRVVYDVVGIEILGELRKRNGRAVVSLCRQLRTPVRRVRLCRRSEGALLLCVLCLRNFFAEHGNETYACCC